MGKEYGVDWINLGYRINADATMKLMVENIAEGALGVDWQGEPLDKFPIMQEVKSIRDDVDLLFVTTVGSPGYSDWMQYVAEPLNKPLHRWRIPNYVFRVAALHSFRTIERFPRWIEGRCGI